MIIKQKTNREEVVFVSLPTHMLYISGSELKIDESSMTGESETQKKNTTDRSCL